KDQLDTLSLKQEIYPLQYTVLKENNLNEIVKKYMVRNLKIIIRLLSVKSLRNVRRKNSVKEISRKKKNRVELSKQQKKKEEKQKEKKRQDQLAEEKKRKKARIQNGEISDKKTGAKKKEKERLSVLGSKEEVLRKKQLQNQSKRLGPSMSQPGISILGDY